MTGTTPMPADEQPDPPAGPWREPVRGGYPDPRLFGLSGREQLEAMLAGHAPAPPMSRLTGVRLSAVGEGTASFELPVSDWLVASQGVISIGLVTLPADAAVACAIQTVLPPATPFSTSELSLRLLAPVHPGTRLTACGRLIQRRRQIALADVTVCDQQQRMVAHGSSMCFVAPSLSPAPDPPSLAQLAGLGGRSVGNAENLDPYERPVLGDVLEEEIWRSRAGLDILQAQLSGSLPAPPIHYLTGLTLTRVAEGEAALSMPASEWLCAPARQRVQGGFIAMLAEAALSSAVSTRLPAGTAMAPVDLKVNYLRPLLADGRLAHAEGRVLHSGRRIAVSQAQVLDADGRAVALATGSAMILPERPASLRSGDA